MPIGWLIDIGEGAINLDEDLVVRGGIYTESIIDIGKGVVTIELPGSWLCDNVSKRMIEVKSLVERRTTEFWLLNIVVFGESSERNCRNQDLFLRKINKLRIFSVVVYGELVKEVIKDRNLFG